MAEELTDELERARVLKNGLQLNLETYEYDDRFVPATGDKDVHTTQELISLLERRQDIDIDARVLCKEKGSNRIATKRVGRDEFLYASKSQSLKESDFFGTDCSFDGGARVGSDFIPLLSGPFNKQLYYYDYLRMHAASFHAYHHDPIAHRIVHIIRDFSLGRGWRVDCKNPLGLALWRAFEDVNNLYDLMHYASDELSIYGEVLLWELPNLETKIGYRLPPGERVPRGMIPRVRLIDPSVIWEVVTYPEDISRVLYYQWVAPTQYQTYTAPGVPSTKFIFQQIPGDQVMHFKSNCVSNEKRGRSILFPVLGYMKRLRDSVNWSIIGMQKASAWSIDTKIEGSQADIDAYIADQQALGTIPEAGSEFVHTAKITREYLSNGASGRGGASSAFDWALSMIAAGTGIPINYLGTHLSGGQTRASAIVATEPVAKLFETRQLKLEMILKAMSVRLFERFGIDAEIEVTFPTVAEQDRTAKIRDLYTAQEAGWISKRRAATIGAKELGVTEYEYDEEQEEIEQDALVEEGPIMEDPLTALARSEDVQPGPNSQEEKRRLSATKGM